MTDSFYVAIPVLRGPVPLAHLLLNNFLCDGQQAIDATCGNGHDTLLLTRLVGAHGHVWAVDIQQQALDETGRRLTEAGLSERVTLLHIGHEELAQHVDGPVHAVLFNLGYLPGGDRTVITRPATTIAALGQALQLLVVGGIIVMTVYPCHDGGAEEQAAVEAWANALAPQDCHCWRMNQTNVSATAPYLLFVQKAG